MFYHLFKIHAAILLISFSSLATTNAISQTPQWPQHFPNEAQIFKERFNQALASSPEELPKLVGLIDCKLEMNHASDLIGLTEAYQISEFKKSPGNSTVEIEIDIDQLEFHSTAKGCAKLRKSKRSQQNLMTHGIPTTIKAPVKLFIEYEQDISLPDFELEIENTIQALLYTPVKPAHPDYPLELITISTTKDSEQPSFSIMFISNKPEKIATENIGLHQIDHQGVVSHVVVVIGKDNKGRLRRTSYINNIMTTMVDQKLHDLMITENYLYKTDASQEPYKYACYNMGEKENVFKVTKDNHCEAVSEDLIGTAGIYVDELYALQLSTQRTAKNPTTRLETNKALLEAMFDEQSIKTKNSPALTQPTIQNTNNAHFIKLQANEKCKLVNKDWSYTGIQCKNNLAHGKGYAEDRQGLKFEGTFNAGKRVKGDIYQNGNMIFSGSLVDDKPEGHAICFYEDEYEECRFFRGKRIDTLYKIRKENSKQQLNIQPVQQVQSNQPYPQAKGVDDYATEALKREGASRAAGLIFDMLW